MGGITLCNIRFPADWPQTVEDYLALGFEYDMAVDNAVNPITINDIAWTMGVSVEEAKAYYRDELKCEGDWAEEAGHE